MINEKEIELVRITEAAHQLGVPTSTVYKLVEDGKLVGYKLPGSCLRVARQEIHQIIDDAAEAAVMIYVRKSKAKMMRR
jgi:excisionase family DNA binding protein